MTQSHAPSDAPHAGESSDSSGSRLLQAWSQRALWQRLAAIASLLLTLVAGGLTAAEALTDRGAEVASQSTSQSGGDGSQLPDGLARGLWTPGSGEPAAGPYGADGAGTAEASEAADAAPELRWSPVLFKTGFSFFIAFTIGFALRSFLRIALVAVGLLALAVFGLQYAGLLNVDWAAMSERWDGLLAWLGPQVSSFQAFITGQLPSAATATAGLYAGWRSR
jgi:uncharacterized membrane protein (Fun14 family)